MFLPSDITLRPGDSGDFVSELQRRLAKRDMLAEGHTTGIYDDQTTGAVRNFQQLSGIQADGIAGPETLRRLNGIVDDADGENPTEEEEEEKELGEDRADDLVAMNRNFDEQETNEAIFDPEHNELDQLEQEQAEALDKEVNQLSDLTQQQEQVIAQREALRDTEPFLDNASHESEQVHAQQEHAREDIPSTDERAPQQEQAHVTTPQDPKGPNVDIEQTREAALPDQQSYMAPTAAATTAMAPKEPTLSPEMQRTEAQLTPPDKQNSRDEGKKLDSKGVKEGETVSEKQLGELSPSQTPSQGQQQQVEIG